VFKIPAPEKSEFDEYLSRIDWDRVITELGLRKLRGKLRRRH
jgi:hypothetical protein